MAKRVYMRPYVVSGVDLTGGCRKWNSWMRVAVAARLTRGLFAMSAMKKVVIPGGLRHKVRHAIIADLL